MHIPDRYYKRIPRFYFIVGVLLVLTSFNMQENKMAAYLYFIAGLISVIYAISVHQARARKRKKRQFPLGPQVQAAQDSQSEGDDQPQPADEQQQAAGNQEGVADNQSAPANEQQSRSGTESRDLPQHGGSVPAPAQRELKT